MAPDTVESHDQKQHVEAGRNEDVPPCMELRIGNNTSGQRAAAAQINEPEHDCTEVARDTDSKESSNWSIRRVLAELIDTDQAQQLKKTKAQLKREELKLSAADDCGGAGKKRVAGQ